MYMLPVVMLVLLVVARFVWQHHLIVVSRDNPVRRAADPWSNITGPMLSDHAPLLLIESVPGSGRKTKLPVFLAVGAVGVGKSQLLTEALAYWRCPPEHGRFVSRYQEGTVTMQVQCVTCTPHNTGIASRGAHHGFTLCDTPGLGAPLYGLTQRELVEQAIAVTIEQVGPIAKVLYVVYKRHNPDETIADKLIRDVLAYCGYPDAVRTIATHHDVAAGRAPNRIAQNDPIDLAVGWNNYVQFARSIGNDADWRTTNFTKPIKFDFRVDELRRIYVNARAAHDQHVAVANRSDDTLTADLNRLKKLLGQFLASERLLQEKLDAKLK